MVLVETPAADFGWTAPSFKLLDTGGVWRDLRELAGERGTVVAFICNHCPYVKAIAGHLSQAARNMRVFGVSTIAICSNDADKYPEDSYKEMVRFSAQNDFTFPYLHDETQDVARAWGAVCTPDFFGLDAELRLKYRGCLISESRKQSREEPTWELVEAMRLISEGAGGPATQHPSVGCSIKWRA